MLLFIDIVNKKCVVFGVPQYLFPQPVIQAIIQQVFLANIQKQVAAVRIWNGFYLTNWKLVFGVGMK
jgi:hypothetical protein